MICKKLINFRPVVVVCFLLFTAIGAYGETYHFQDNIYSPIRICTDNLGNIYFTDSFKHRACRMDSAGNIQLEIPGLGIPMAIAVDQNLNIFVSDRSDSSVKIFDNGGNPLGLLETNADEFRIPSDIEIDSEGNIYVVDSKENCIRTYNSQRNFKLKFGEDILHYPVSIAVNDVTSEIIVGQNYQDSEGQIFVFSKNGELLRQFGAFGHEPNKFTRIQGITIDSNSRIYICDAFQSLVQIWDSDGNFITEIGGYMDDKTQLRIPLDAKFLTSNQLLITSYNSSKIFVYQLNLTESGLQAKSDDTIIAKSSLLQNFPNPSNPDTWIPYTLHENSNVTIYIYNVLGNCIKTFKIGYQPAGKYISSNRALYWNGKNEQGVEVPSGLYFYKIQVNDFTSYKKLIIMK